MEESPTPIIDIRKAAWEEVKRSKELLVLFLLIGVVGNLFMLSFGVFSFALAAPWIPFIIWVAILHQSMRRKFWKQFAKEKKWIYTKNAPVEKEQALIFDEGHSGKIQNMVKGGLDDTTARIFEFSFSRGHGKHQTTYYYTAFGFQFSEGAFPHCYLNRLHKGYDVSHKGERILLPAELEEKFHLYAPRKYEIEALAIFTPDMLEFFLDEKWPHDIELVDQELLIFRKEFVNTKQELEMEFTEAQKLMRKLAPKLQQANFTPIGDMPHVLN